MTLVPKDHVRFNRYWQGFLDSGSTYGRQKLRRSVDPRKRLFGPVSDARASLARFDWRKQGDGFGDPDPRKPTSKLWGGTLDSQISHLQEKLARVLKLQLIHLAGVGEIKPLTTGPDPLIISYQPCSRCGGAVAPAIRAPVTPGIEELIDEDTGFWKVGIRLLERWEGANISDRVWWVLPPDGEPLAGFIPCSVLADL